jgi:adenylate cyclase
VKAAVNRLLTEAERRSERLSAYIRLATFAVLAAVVFGGTRTAAFNLVVASLLAYGALALIGIWLAHRRFFRPWLPWLFATADVGLLINFLAVLTLAQDLPLTRALQLPGAAMIFLFLAQAALRFRPALVLYTALLFVAGLAGLYIEFGANTDMATMRGPSDTPEAMARHHLVMNPTGEAMRLAIVLMTAAVLAILVWRARHVLITQFVAARQTNNLARFLDPNLAERLARDPVDPAEGRRQQAAVLFVDIRGFTALSETLPPAELTRFLNEFRRRMARPIGDHGGTIDKFMGDAVLAVFGVPDPSPADAKNSLAAAFDMLAAIADWNRVRRAAGLADIAVGIGIHYGEVVAGVLGLEAPVEYTVIGDTVNAAQRIEALTRELGVPLLVSAELLAAAGEAGHAMWLPVGSHIVHGRRKPVEVFRPADIDLRARPPSNATMPPT